MRSRVVSAISTRNERSASFSAMRSFASRFDQTGSNCSLGDIDFSWKGLDGRHEGVHQRLLPGICEPFIHHCDPETNLCHKLPRAQLCKLEQRQEK